MVTQRRADRNRALECFVLASNFIGRLTPVWPMLL